MINKYICFISALIAASMLMANGQPADSAMTIKMSAAQEAVQTLVSDPVFSQAVLSISITTGNGEPLAAYNPNTMVVPASNMKLLSTGAAILWVEIFLENGRALNFFGVNALRSAGDIYFPVIIGIIVMWGIQVVGSYILGITFGWGLIAMWFIFALDENIRGLIFLRRWNSFKWVGKGFLK